MNEVAVLMVDVDGVVLVHPDPRGWSANLERDLGLSSQRLHAAFFEPHFTDVVHGRAGLRDRLESVLAEIAPHLTCDQLIDYWVANDSHVNLDLLEQLERVRRGGTLLHLATVQEHERTRYLWHTLGLHERFDAIHYSADVGWAKPAAEFYAAAERRCGFAAGEIFFIDDRIENVEAARKRGWRAALWTGKSTLDELLASSPETESG